MPKPQSADGLVELTHDKPLAGKRILIVVENLPVPFDRRVWMEARTLKAAGAVVSVICPTGKGHEEREQLLEGINIYRHSLPLDASGTLGYLLEYSAALFWEAWLTLKVLRKQGFDVIHGCNPPDLIFLVALPFKLFGVKYLFDHHDINPELYEAKFQKRGLFWWLMVLFERLTFKTADISIATNHSYQQIAVERGGMSPADVFIVRSGPDLSRVKAVEPALKWRNEREFLVGYVGVMGDQEGIDILLEAVAHLVKEEGRRDIQFVLVGGGPSLNSLKAQSKGMGLEEFVTFTGRAPDQDLFEVLSTADVCVNPDRVNAMNDKSTMNKIMEYMAVAKPIVQFELAEGRFSAQGASLYAKANDPIDFASKVTQLLEDPDERHRMGQLGRERVEKDLSWAASVEPLLQAYKKVLGIKS